jgi:hypothetical protein
MTVIRHIELTETWGLRNGNGQTFATARVTLRRGNEHRLRHEHFIGRSHADALRLLAAALERGYPLQTPAELDAEALVTAVDATQSV